MASSSTSGFEKNQRFDGGNEHFNGANNRFAPLTEVLFG